MDIPSLNENQFLSRKEVAHLLGVSLVTLNNLRRKSILKPSHKVGRKPLYRYGDVLKQIEIYKPKGRE
ncbi:helix-turn-helix transcriptional regulator [Salinimicrobium sp. CAU 1759]